ncbi:DUF488 domain-containing protein [Microbacterium sp.]|uniref:DUF488 domain-containing protein n=1 Tax=Microbacterium sp. TaxID=51671 RepID=UPI003F9D9C08
MGELRIKRAYEEPAPDDGCRVLVDRLWPRGVSKERAQLEEWMKDIAPSPALRTWWNHDPARLDDFAARYTAELDANDAVADIRALIGAHPVVTLVYAARDPRINHAAVLRDYLVRTA